MIMEYFYYCYTIVECRGCHGRDRMVVGFIIPIIMQSVPITTNDVSLNPAQASFTRTALCDKVCQ